MWRSCGKCVGGGGDSRGDNRMPQGKREEGREQSPSFNALRASKGDDNKDKQGKEQNG